MTIGKIKWFNPTKGYGFIEQEGNKDVFLHVSALEEAGIETLKEGEEIEFEIGENKGKQNAINIKKVDHEGTGNRTA
jgi:CspA family cold shock protein